MEGNLHYGTSYDSKKWKFHNPSWLGISGKTWDKPIKFSAEFYPHETLYKINNYVVYKTTQGYSPNNKVVWLNGGTYNRGGGPIGGTLGATLRGTLGALETGTETTSETGIVEFVSDDIIDAIAAIS